MADLEEIRKMLDKRELEVAALEDEARKARAKLSSDRIKYNAIKANVDSFSHDAGVHQDDPGKVLGDLMGRVAHDIEIYGAIRRAVREAISRQPLPGFSTRDILEHIKRSHPEINVDNNRSNINAYLNQFVREGVINIERTASGPTPTFYRKK